MAPILLLFITLPLVAFLVTSLLGRNRETAIFWTATVALGLHLLATVALTAYWMAGTEEHLFYTSPAIYQRGHVAFHIDLLFDRRTMVYALLSGTLGVLIALFSRYYMHRDPGFRRFYATMMLFFTGLDLVIFSGNFQVLFMGWETIGITSFLLIGFYRERYLPVKNALKVVSLYRLSDVVLLVAVWMCHEVYQADINFHELYGSEAVVRTLQESGAFALLIPLLFLSVAAVKSAQLPFSSWLPRAMEGPTTSSAIFYGSLYVHIGLFLMMRIEPFWADNLFIRVIMGLMGGCTALVATAIGRVQSSVKTQIAYSSSVQIGLMFIELALGWETLALVHFAGNALLRSYQLLVSPSVMNYLIHEQFYHFERPKDRIANTLTGRLRNTVLILSVKEWNLDRAMFRYLWSPFKALGRGLSFLDHGWGALIPVAVFALGLASIFSTPLYELMLQARFGTVAAGMSLMLTLHAFAERSSAIRGWLFLVLSQLFVVMAVGFNEQLPAAEVMLYLSGVLVAGTTGYLALKRFDRIEDGHDLQGHYGHVYEHPKIGLAFLLSALGIAGFPLTPTFIGIDLVLTHVHTSQYVLVTMLALSFIFLEISALRIYSRIFLGPHAKAYHEIAFKNS